MITHIIGSYLHNDWTNELMLKVVTSAIKTVIKYAPKALENPEDYDARAQLMWISSLCCCPTLTVGLPGDGTTHNIEGVVDGIYDKTHGAGLAVMILAYFRYLKPIKTERLAKILQWIFHLEYDFADPAETVDAGIARMEDFLKRIGMPTTLPELGIDGSRLTEMAEKAVLGGPLGHFYPMDAKQIEDMYRLAL